LWLWCDDQEAEWLDFTAAVTIIARKGFFVPRNPLAAKQGREATKAEKWKARRRSELMEETEQAIARLVATLCGETRKAPDVVADGDGGSGPVDRDSKRATLLDTVAELEEMLGVAAGGGEASMDNDEAELLEQLLLDVNEELRALDQAEAEAELLRDPRKELLAVAAAARVILDFSSRGAESRGAIRSMGGLAPVLMLLDSDSADIATLGAITLGNLCCDEPATRELLTEAGAVAALLARGVGSFESALQDAAAFALGNLVADCPEARTRLREAGGVDALVVLLASTQSSVRKQAAWALANSCDHEPLSRVAARKAGAISALVGCLEHHSEDVVRYAVMCVGVLCVDEPVSRSYFRQAGGLAHLQRIVRAEQTDGAVLNRKLVRQAIWALGHASRGDPKSKEQLRCVKNAFVCTLLYYKNRSICQDRLGTHIGKTLEGKSDAFFGVQGGRDCDEPRGYDARALARHAGAGWLRAAAALHGGGRVPSG
jgi:hypothetical protein